MSSYSDILRRSLIAKSLADMSDDERRLYAVITNEENEHREIMSALQGQHEDIRAIGRHVGKQNWWTDFASDIAANFTTDGLIWLGSRLFRKL